MQLKLDLQRTEERVGYIRKDGKRVRQAVGSGVLNLLLERERLLGKMGEMEREFLRGCDAIEGAVVCYIVALDWALESI